MTDLEFCRKRNSFRSQYVNKRFNNKHARSSNWRHYNHKKYYKKCLLHGKHKTIQTYLNMEYDDVLSNHQQKLENDIDFYLSDDRTHRIPRSKPIDYTAAIRKLDRFVDDLCKGQCHCKNCNCKTDEYLLHLHLHNYKKNCKSQFLSRKNWFLYQLHIESHQRLKRMFGSRYNAKSSSFYCSYDGGFLNSSYFSNLSTIYYDAKKYGKYTDDDGFTVDEFKCIEMKDAHCNLLLDRIYSLGESEMHRTLNVLYYSVPYASFSIDICTMIIECMGSFPQTAPKPVEHFYYDNFETRKYYVGSIAPMFYISQKEMKYPLKLGIDLEEDDTITCAWDDREMVCQFNIRDTGFYDALHATDLEGYKLSEIYHLNRVWDQEFVLVGKLTSISHSREVFIYWDHAFYRNRDIDEKFVTILLSEFWNDLWEKIPSDCVKVDCYNKTKLPKLIRNTATITHNASVDIKYDYEY